MKDRGKDAHQYDSLFGKFMLSYCLCAAFTSMGKNMCLETGLDEGKGRTRLTYLFNFSSLLKESPCFQKTVLFWQLWPTFTHSFLSYDMRTRTHTHTHTPTHAVTHQWRGKQRHLEKSSSGKHWHDLRGLTAFPITLAAQRSARWLPSAFAVATDGCTANWWNI